MLQLLLNSSATDIVLVTLPRTAVETAIAWYTSCCTMARGHCLNSLIVLAAVHGLLSLPGQSTASSVFRGSPRPPQSSGAVHGLLSLPGRSTASSVFRGSPRPPQSSGAVHGLLSLPGRSTASSVFRGGARSSLHSFAPFPRP